MASRGYLYVHTMYTLQALLKVIARVESPTSLALFPLAKMPSYAWLPINIISGRTLLGVEFWTKPYGNCTFMALSRSSIA
jgi:hypothetical protein